MKSPDIVPAGSVWQHKGWCLILRQTSYYFQDYIFNAFQNLPGYPSRTDCGCGQANSAAHVMMIIAVNY